MSTPVRVSRQAVTIALPPWAIAWLDRQAQSGGISRSQLVVRLIAAAAARDAAEEPELEDLERTT